MAKTFNGTTDLIDLGSPAGLDNLGGSPGAHTYAAWIYPIGWGETNSAGRIFDKWLASAGRFLSVYNGGGGAGDPVASFEYTIYNAETPPYASAYATDSTISLNHWWFIAVTYALADGGPRLWVGDLVTAVAEVTYSATTRVDAIGTYVSDASANACIGNRIAADRTFEGRIAEVSCWAGAASSANLEILRRGGQASRQTFSGLTLAGYWALNDATAALCKDESSGGNNGTVTGTSVSAGPYPVGLSAPLVVGIPPRQAVNRAGTY